MTRKTQLSGRHFVLTKISNPTVPCARVRKLIFQVNFVNWDRESVCSHFSSLVSLDFVRFVMAITIAGEVTENMLTGLACSDPQPHPPTFFKHTEILVQEVESYLEKSFMCEMACAKSV